MADLARLWRHILCDHKTALRAFPKSSQEAIQRAIAAGEQTHAGQVRFAVEGALPTPLVWRGVSPRERALDVFSRLRVWDTEANCGVLIYVLLADKAVEVVADRGINTRVDASAWGSLCRKMEEAFRGGRFELGAVGGVQAVSALLAQHYPATGEAKNELGDEPILL